MGTVKIGLKYDLKLNANTTEIFANSDWGNDATR